MITGEAPDSAAAAAVAGGSEIAAALTRGATGATGAAEGQAGAGAAAAGWAPEASCAETGETATDRATPRSSENPMQVRFFLQNQRVYCAMHLDSVKASLGELVVLFHFQRTSQTVGS